MSALKAFFAFWYDFIIGDDWVAALGVVIGLAATALLVHLGVNAWWLLPALVAVVFGISLRRAIAS
ncbi:hypothetical protein [Nocardia alni]|uniref:hypothetical protein n=1 Tax=Nocardia alni TaxID=2815723 RepID=UPI001C244C63|nr:hypothetical protein [Nocardia alni]